MARGEREEARSPLKKRGPKQKDFVGGLSEFDPSSLKVFTQEGIPVMLAAMQSRVRGVEFDQADLNRLGISPEQLEGLNRIYLINQYALLGAVNLDQIEMEAGVRQVTNAQVLGLIKLLEAYMKSARHLNSGDEIYEALIRRRRGLGR